MCQLAKYILYIQYIIKSFKKEKENSLEAEDFYSIKELKENLY